MTRDDEVLYLARKLRYVREAGPNSGNRVNGIQRWAGGYDLDSWCCEFATMILDIAYEGDPPNAPIPRLKACESIHKLALRNGWIVAEPVPADLALRLDSAGIAEHVYIVTERILPDLIGTISGNTSADGASPNGDRVAEHDVKRSPSIVFVHYTRPAVP